MGKGDKKSKRGKIILGSHGVRRPKIKKNAYIKVEKPVKAEAKVKVEPKEEVIVKAEPKKVHAKKVETAPKPDLKKKSTP